MIVHSDFLGRTLGHFYRQESGGKWVLKEKAALLQTPQAGPGQVWVVAGVAQLGKRGYCPGLPSVLHCGGGMGPTADAVQRPLAANPCAQEVALLHCRPFGMWTLGTRWCTPACSSTARAVCLCFQSVLAIVHATRKRGHLCVCHARACGSEPGHAGEPVVCVCAAGPQLKGRDGMSACPCCGTGACSSPARAACSGLAECCCLCRMLLSVPNAAACAARWLAMWAVCKGRGRTAACGRLCLHVLAALGREHCTATASPAPLVRHGSSVGLAGHRCRRHIPAGCSCVKRWAGM